MSYEAEKLLRISIFTASDYFVILPAPGVFYFYSLSVL